LTGERVPVLLGKPKAFDFLAHRHAGNDRSIDSRFQIQPS